MRNLKGIFQNKSFLVLIVFGLSLLFFFITLNHTTMYSRLNFKYLQSMYLLNDDIFPNHHVIPELVSILFVIVSLIYSVSIIFRKKVFSYTHIFCLFFVIILSGTVSQYYIAVESENFICKDLKRGVDISLIKGIWKDDLLKELKKDSLCENWDFAKSSN